MGWGERGYGVRYDASSVRAYVATFFNFVEEEESPTIAAHCDGAGVRSVVDYAPLFLDGDHSPEGAAKNGPDWGWEDGRDEVGEMPEF